MSVKQNGRTKNILFFVTDAILIIGVILTFFFYTHYYLDLIQKQNISEIQNINESAANTSSAFFNNQQIRITSIIKYVTSGSKAMNYQEVLNYTCDSDSDENCHFEIIAPNYKGHAAVRNGEGNFVEVDYSNSNYYSLQYLILGTQSANDGILCTMEFTDSYDANRSFALYSHVTLDDGTGTFKNYMLMSVSKSSDFVNLIASDGGYDGLSSVIITANGDYVFGSSSFKSSNLFKYFLDYSGINRPTMYELMNKLGSTTSGIYYYKNSEYQDCIYVYT